MAVKNATVPAGAAAYRTLSSIADRRIKVSQ